METIVSRILRVHRSSRHEPNSKNLQNKQGIGGGVSAGSPMLKLVKEVESILLVNSPAYIFTYIFLSVASLIYEKGSWSTFHGEWVFAFRNGREADAFIALQPFFLFVKKRCPSLPPQRLVDLLMGGFVCGLRENMFFNYQGISWEIPGRPSL